MTNKTDLMEEIVSLSKRRGFIFPASEIYGGTGAIFDFGPLGVALKNNLKQLWWQSIVLVREEVVGLDSAILTKREVLKASGHEKGFFDWLVECKNCHSRFKKDEIGQRKVCPVCQKKQFTAPAKFNLMFKTELGPVEGDLAYLRPETAQGIFVNFKNLLDTARVKIPFGVAQIGKAFRNEITTGNFIFRLREFEQMELEYFVRPKEAEKWYKYWVDERFKWYLKLGIQKKNLRLRPHKKEELAHYAIASTDVEYKFPFGWQEIEGIANRQDFDLLVHQKGSGKDLSFFDERTRNKYIPYIIEPSAGVERIILALLVDGFEKGKSQNSKIKSTSQKSKLEGGGKHKRGEGEVVLHLNPKLAPVKAAVFPLVNKDKLPQIAWEIYEMLKGDLAVQIDGSGSIGRRYRRQDEIGTPWCITVDFQTLKDKTVTIRDRDSLKQERVKIKELPDILKKKSE